MKTCDCFDSVLFLKEEIFLLCVPQEPERSSLVAQVSHKVTAQPLSHYLKCRMLSHPIVSAAYLADGPPSLLAYERKNLGSSVLIQDVQLEMDESIDNWHKRPA